MTAIRLRLVALVAAISLLHAARATAQPAPYHHWRTLDTPHFHVHVAAGLEREGRVAGAAAEHAYALLARELVAPRGPIDLIVSDDADYSNGSATPFPTNRIIIFATPPIESGGLGLSDDWIGLVVTHELTHIFHLDRTRGIWSVAQRVFGRAPVLFPNAYSPSWLTEGLAVYYESRLTPGGRIHSAEHRTIARAAAQEHLLPELGDLSAGNPRFPAGESPYAYGSLFVQYLAETRGDSTVPRFVERQSGALVPLLQERAARRAFGTSLAEAFARWRDSVSRAAEAPRPPLAGWRELTGRSYAAQVPRWLDDTTLVYSASDGRESNAAYTLTLGGRRTRLSRRSGSSANVPLRGGGLLFAQPDFVRPDEVRSDLWIERDGVQRRLTHGARLIQPDVRRSDGAIVAVELAAGRSSLVLLDSLGGHRRVLREGGPDETWSEPRWSPSGRPLAAVHRTHGGRYSVELIDDLTGDARTIVASRELLSSPVFGPQPLDLLYVSEEHGAPDAYLARNVVGRGPSSATEQLTGTTTALLALEPSPTGTTVAGVILRADGFHVGIAPAPSRSLAVGAGATSASAPADTQSLAPGSYEEYDARRGIAPRYWLPIVEGGASGATRLGALTSGRDAVGRHAYSAYLALETTGRFSVGGLAYRYSGARRALMDVVLSQDWTNQGRILDSTGARLGIAARRIQDLSLAATFVRPRYRTYAAVTAGLGLERRRFATDPAPLLAQLDPSFSRDYTYPRAFVGATWSNAQQPLLAISREDGITLGVTARERLRTDEASRTLSSSVVGTAAGYRSLDLPGFAHHVLALRLAGGLSDSRATTSFELGGTSGGTLAVVPGVNVGEGRRTFAVRGFPAAAVYGTRAVAASLEYRAPLLLKGRGTWAIPALFDRSSISAFADAGTATCAASTTFRGVCSPAPVIGRTIASVGGELGVSFAFLQVDVPELVRLGIAVPVAGRTVVSSNVAGVSAASVYVALGYSF